MSRHQRLEGNFIGTDEYMKINNLCVYSFSSGCSMTLFVNAQKCQTECHGARHHCIMLPRSLIAYLSPSIKFPTVHNESPSNIEIQLTDEPPQTNSRGGQITVKPDANLTVCQTKRTVKTIEASVIFDT